MGKKKGLNPAPEKPGRVLVKRALAANVPAKKASVPVKKAGKKAAVANVLAKKSKKGRAKRAGGKRASAGLLGKKVTALESEIKSVRKKLLQNEAVLGQKIAEKMKAEAQLNLLLKKSFSEEKALLASIKRAALRKEDSLKRKVSSLESINQLYEAKKARLNKARKKHSVLKRQLELLEKQAGALKPYV